MLINNILSVNGVKGATRKLEFVTEYEIGRRPKAEWIVCPPVPKAALPVGVDKSIFKSTGLLPVRNIESVCLCTAL